MDNEPKTNAGLVDTLIDDGRPLLKLTGLALIGSGLFAYFLGATGHFLPRDITVSNYGSERPGGVHFRLVDGNVRFLNLSTSYNTLTALATKAAKNVAGEH